MVRCIPPFSPDESDLFDQCALEERKLKPKGVKNVVAHKLGPKRVAGPKRTFDDEDELVSHFQGGDDDQVFDDEDELILDLIASNE